nr:ras-related protein Rab-44 isoform X2 [Macaca nemestrina]
METGQRTSRKVRKLGSSRRRQTREPADGEDAEVAPEPESWSSQAAAELQAFFQDCGAKERGFVTREDLAVAKFSFLGSKEESEMIFDWVDVERKGHLSLEEFSSGLKNIFGSSQSSHRLRRRKPLPSKRVSATTSFPALEEADAEEKEAFLAFIEQLGTGHLLPKQTEIWQLWGQLRQEEPQLAGNLAGFLAKMTSRLQEAQADKEALELTLKKCDSDHHREVQQLYEEMEQQIRQEKQQLQAESDSRGLALTSQMQDVLEAKEREVQRLAEGQREAQVEAEAAAPGKPAPPRGSPPGGAQPGAGAGPKEPTRTPPTMAEQEAQPRPSLMTAHEEEQGPRHSREPRAESRLEDPGMDSREAGLTPSPGDPMAAGEPQANPDYLFHVIFLGDSNVGKTSFLHLLHQNSFATGLTATVGVDFRVKTLLVDNKCFVLQLWDTAGQERYHSMTRQLLRKADGVVLMYDITSQKSFGHVRYWLDCLQDAGSDGVVILLLGNKMDCEEERQVSTEAGQQLARELGVSFGECSAALGHNILEPGW